MGNDGARRGRIRRQPLSRGRSSAAHRLTPVAQTAAASSVVLGIGGPLRLFTASPLVLPGPYAYFIYRRAMTRVRLHFASR
jgi:hypothetical protein